MDIKSPEEFLRAYEKAANSGNFDEVAPLLSDDAILVFKWIIYRDRKHKISFREDLELIDP